MNSFRKLKTMLIKKYYQTILSTKDSFHEIIYSLKTMPYLEKLTDERQKVQKEIKLLKDFQFPYYQYPEYNRAFLKYLISTKEPRDAAFNKSNFLMVLGPEGVGKTWFMKYNLKTLEAMEMNVKPLIVYWDLKCETFMNFDIFFFHFKTLILEFLSMKGKMINAITGKPHLTKEIIKDVLYYNFADEYIDLFGRDVLKCILDDEEEILIDEEHKSPLSLIFAEIVEKKGKGLLTFKKNFDSIAEIIKNSLKIDELSAYLTLSLLIISKIEHEQRQKPYKTTYYTFGIEVYNKLYKKYIKIKQTDFLLDIINYIAGYHDLNLFLNDEKLHDLQYIFSKYPHCSLLLSNFDCLLDSYPDQRIKDLLDHLLLRLFTETKCRTHFPVIIESTKSRFFNRTMWEMMHQCEELFPAIELYGLDREEIPNYLSEIYNIHQINLLRKILGQNPNDWHAITKEILLKSPKLNVWDIGIDMTCEHISREKSKFLSKMAQFYTNIEVFQELDDGTIDFKVLAIMEKMSNHKFDGNFNVNFPINDVQFLENPIMKSLIDCNIIYLLKYFPIIQIQKRLYILFMREWVKLKKAEMSYKEKIAFFIYKRFNGLDYSLAKGNIVDFGLEIWCSKIEFDNEIVINRKKLQIDENYDKK